MLEDIIAVAHKCGLLIAEAAAADIKIKGQNPKNLVTEYDTKVQEILEHDLGNILPSASFLGEEGNNGFEKSDLCFVCDPIDGTSNFVKNIRHSAVSIALLKERRPILGVVYNPYRDEMFWAEKGKGAFVNGEQINTTDQNIANCLIAFGTSPYNKNLRERTWQKAGKCMDIGLDIRRMGAAVLDLTDVAIGRFGMYWEYEVQPWDYAAGALIVEEAGGKISTIDNKPIVDFFAPTSIVAMANESGNIFFSR